MQLLVWLTETETGDLDEIRQKHGIIVTTSGQTVYYADEKGVKRIAYALKCKIHHKG